MKNLWKVIETCAQYNSGEALFIFDAVAMNMHFQTLVERSQENQMLEKQQLIIAAMSMLGTEACSFRGMRQEYFVHLAAQTSLGLMYDNPIKHRR